MDISTIKTNARKGTVMEIMTGFERKNGSQIGAMARNLGIQLDCQVKTWTVIPDGNGGFTVKFELVPIPDVKPLLELCTELGRKMQDDIKRREDEAKQGKVEEDNPLAPPKGFPGWDVNWFHPKSKAVGQ